jgi:hypothetical protein
LCKLSSMSAAATEDTFDLEWSWLARIRCNKEVMYMTEESLVSCGCFDLVRRRQEIQRSVHLGWLVSSQPSNFVCYKYFINIFFAHNGTLIILVCDVVDSENKWMMHGWDIETKFKNNAT